MSGWIVVAYLLAGIVFTRHTYLLDVLGWPVNFVGSIVLDIKLARAKRAKAKRLEPERLERIEQMLNEERLSVDEALDWAASGEWPR